MQYVKQCKECKQTKPVTEYYQHRMMKDGLFKKCKECIKEERIRYTIKLSERDLNGKAA